MFQWGSGTAATECRDNSWLYVNSRYQWTLSLFNANTYHVFGTTTAGGITYPLPTDTHGVRPVLFLKDNVVISDGLGTEDSPFKLSQ